MIAFDKIKKWYVIIIVTLVLLFIIGATVFIISRKKEKADKPNENALVPSSQIFNDLALPVGQFKQRITKKPFGLYVSPNNSPVRPEKFTGYHTAVDIEYEDIAEDVPVFAVSDGRVVLSRTASGYGGVIMMEIKLDNAKHHVVYGHVRPSYLPAVGQEFKKGEQISTLGTGYSAETDNERRHLHFGVLSNDRIDLRGYVQDQTELGGWIDPQTLY